MRLAELVEVGGWQLVAMSSHTALVPSSEDGHVLDPDICWCKPKVKRAGDNMPVVVHRSAEDRKKAGDP